eukprot:CAMPEP_0184490028 /NCGR_PEP_ID=MMETSP0113_2-20130426/16974_1 /TAXON_ID=91329 /ORGANISM="Norrisiella sphaerica, Strain BC52" /LENGTH=312 /DNA_ID=CAMNT_0026873755 /DNA_START=64 /DNA_END=1002 /DNA_ORIENTATION=-
MASSGSGNVCDTAQRVCSEPGQGTVGSKKNELQTPGLILPLGLAALEIALVKRCWGPEYETKDNAFATCSYVYPLVVSILYLGLITLGQRFMKNREAMDDFCKPCMLIYNLYQTVFNTWWVVMVILEVVKLGYPPFTLPLTFKADQFNLGFLIWLHYQNKYLEMFDTVFMVLRKKTRQVSFLHCYHHLLLLWAWFVVCRFGCGGEAYFGALMNSIIHVLMYGYYFLSTIKIPVPWKRYLTKLQMLQFVVCLVHTLGCAYKNIYPRSLAMVEVWVMVNMLYLFNEFYKQAYAAKKAREAKLASLEKAASKKDQ